MHLAFLLRENNFVSEEHFYGFHYLDVGIPFLGYCFSKQGLRFNKPGMNICVTNYSLTFQTTKHLLNHKTVKTD